MNKQISYVELIVILLLIAVCISGINTMKNRKKNIPVPTPIPITTTNAANIRAFQNSDIKNPITNYDDFIKKYKGYKYDSISSSSYISELRTLGDTSTLAPHICSKCKTELSELYIEYIEVDDKKKIIKSYSEYTEGCFKCKNEQPIAKNIFNYKIINRKK